MKTIQAFGGTDCLVGIKPFYLGELFATIGQGVRREPTIGQNEQHPPTNRVASVTNVLMHGKPTRWQDAVRYWSAVRSRRSHPRALYRNETLVSTPKTSPIKLWGGRLCFFLLLVLPRYALTEEGQGKPAEAPVTSSGPMEAPVARGAVEDTEVRVELIARRVTTLSSELAARVEKAPLLEGESFAEGDLLVALHCRLPQARLDRAKAVLAAEVAKAGVYGRLDKLKVTSTIEMVTAKAEEEKARAELAVVQTEVDSCRIVAPFAGQIVSLAVRQHQYVKPGEALMEILDPRELEVAFNMPSKWLQCLRKQDRLMVRIDETNKSYPAKIISFGAKIDAVSQHVKVIGEIIGSFPELSPGMSGRIVSGLRQQLSPKP